MKTKSILFNTEMVRAILTHQKTCTRRFANDKDKPYAAVGDLLWVKETSAIRPDSKIDFAISYRANYSDNGNINTMPSVGMERRSGTPEKTFPSKQFTINGAMAWHPSLFMPRWASRITLEIEGMRKEPLQDITEESARREGFTDREAFKSLWIELYGQKSWDDNPNVWVIDFKTIFKNVDDIHK